MTSRPWIVAHRGFSATCPENTFAAFDAAVAAGADAMELDLQLSADGVAVAYHDETLHKAGRRGARIHELELAQLRRLDMGRWFGARWAGEPIPTVDEILERYAGRLVLLLELKAVEADAARHARLAAAVTRAVLRHECREHVLLLSFDDATLAAAKRSASSVRRILLRGEAVRPGTKLRRDLADHHGLCLPGRHVSAPLVAWVHRAGKRIFTYRCDATRSARAAVTAGVDGLMADDPSELARRVRALLP
jgi:glycerophosphoryl diester phosphodiesterase